MDIQRIEHQHPLTLEFDPGAAGCGPVPNVDNYDLVEINGNTTWSVTLDITKAQLIADYGDAADYTGSGDPVELDVDFGEVCERDIPNYEYLLLEDQDMELATGFGTGTYIGRTAPLTTPAQGASSSEAVYQQLGNCQELDLDDRWHGERQRWETSDQYRYTQKLWIDEVVCTNPGDPDCVLGFGSDWELIMYNLGYKWNNRWPNDFDALDISLPSPVVANPGMSCVNFEPGITTKIDPVDTIALLIDRSGSMTETWKNGATTKRKIDWARKGATGFALVGQDTGLSLSLAAFNDEILPLGSLTGVPLTATPPPGITAAGVEYLIDEEPIGTTAIGDAVAYAVTDMLTDPSAANAVYLLTDGESNAGMSIAEASALAEEAEIPVFISPIGTFDASELEGLANASDGQLFPTLAADEIPASMFAMRAKMRGEDLSALYEESTLSKSYVEYPGHVEYDIVVENGAERLAMLLTPRAEYFNSWAVGFVLSGPQGETITPTSTGNVVEDADRFFYLITVPNPSPGTWTMRLEAPAVTEPPKVNPEAQLLMAHIEHEGPRCRVNTSDTLIDDTSKEVTVFAEADWDGLVGEGVEYFGEVKRPDGTVSTFTLTPQQNGLASGVFSDYSYDGGYRVKVRCEVAADATYARGEEEDYELPAEEVPGEFERTGMSYFVLDADLPLPLGSNLCQASDPDFDSDGIPDRCDLDMDGDDVPNSEEGIGDTDGDGTPDIIDRDSDDDGDFDGEDWDPVDPFSHRRYTQGDFNGDGLDDLAWGEPDYNSGSGRIMVKYVGEDDPEPWHQDTAGILGVAASNEHFGAAVAAGDFNGDGYVDLAIGVPSQNIGSLADAGVVQIIYGSSTGLTPTGDQYWHENSSGILGSAESGDQFGARLSTGDFNCDGYLDVVIGAPDEGVGSNDEAGAVHVLYGSAGGVSAVDDLWFQGDSGVNGSSETGDRFGDELAVGDFNGDTCDDLVIGAPFENWGSAVDAGNAYVIYGTPWGLLTNGDWTLVQGVLQHPAEANDRFATRLWVVEDGYGDQYDDLVIMSPGDCGGMGYKGFNYVWGSSSGLTTTNNVWFCREYK